MYSRDRGRAKVRATEAIGAESSRSRWIDARVVWRAQGAYREGRRRGGFRCSTAKRARPHGSISLRFHQRGLVRLASHCFPCTSSAAARNLLGPRKPSCPTRASLRVSRSPSDGTVLRFVTKIQEQFCAAGSTEPLSCKLETGMRCLSRSGRQAKCPCAGTASAT